MSAARWEYRIALAVLATMLGACSALPGRAPSPAVSPPVAPPPSVIPTTGLDEAMQYYEHLRRQPASALLKEHEKAAQAIAQTRNDLNRVKLALLLSLPNTPFHDNGAALNLLNELTRDAKATSSGLRNLAHLLATLLAEQQRVNANTDDLSQKLKEEQKRAADLQEKVDAIKNMEKKLMRRDKH